MATSAPSKILLDLNVPHERDVPLGAMTWYGVGGRASVLARPSSVQQLSALASRCHEAGVPVYVLGNGANLLVADEGVQGVVVRLDDPCFKQVKVNAHILTAGAGSDLPKLVLLTAKSGLGGFECLAGIPASIGGAIRMNAGGAFGQIGRTVKRVMVCDATGQIYYRDRDDLVFGYRKTNIVAPYILEAEFELTSDDPGSLIKQVKEIFLYKKSSQPLADHSAGCAFKNGPRRAETPTLETHDKISAGQLIDRAGLKGFRIGGAEVSSQHANFIIAHRDCTAHDVLSVLEHVQHTVSTHSGFVLEREVVVWP